MIDSFCPNFICDAILCRYLIVMCQYHNNMESISPTNKRKISRIFCFQLVIYIIVISSTVDGLSAGNCKIKIDDFPEIYG